MTIPYQKPYLSSSQICAKLIEQNLIIADIDFASRVLERCSYYRFKAYLCPFQDPTTKKFAHGTQFEAGYQLYEFDSAIRMFLFTKIEHIEIGVRSLFDQWMTVKTENPFWYLDSGLFSKKGRYISTVNKMRGHFVDSEELFVRHYQDKYHNEFCSFYRDLPPGWVAIELMTFGNLVNLMNNITESTIQNLKLNRFANKKLAVEKFKTLCAWMSTLQQVRNHCGHHTRLFTRNLQAPTGIKRILSKEVELVKTNPASGKRAEDQLNRLYTAVAALQRLYTGLGYDDKFGYVIAELFDRYPEAKKFKVSMGFPLHWEKEPLFF